MSYVPGCRAMNALLYVCSSPCQICHPVRGRTRQRGSDNKFVHHCFFSVFPVDDFADDGLAAPPPWMVIELIFTGLNGRSCVGPGRWSRGMRAIFFTSSTLAGSH